MFGRDRPPLMARIPASAPSDGRPGTLDRPGLDALLTLWSEIGPGVVLLTGGEERGEIAIGMAAAAAAAGRDAALVECDFAAPRLAGKLGLDPVPGFGEYLAHEAEAPEILQAAILAGPGSTLAAAPLVCIAAGSPTGLGPVLLASESFRHAIERLRAAYDVVVLDGPAPDDESSLRAAAPQADRVIATCPRSRLPRRLRGFVDGLVEPAA
jgi:MinD-like ATPase involved in chromosome partitioning or flagellar assembly